MRSDGADEFERDGNKMSVVHQSHSEATVIPLDVVGILDDRHGQFILDAYRGVIEDPKVRVVFEVGSQVTATLPEFWVTMLSDVFEKAVNGIDACTTPDEARAFEKKFREDRFSLTYSDAKTDASKDRDDARCRIAHRFVGFLDTYYQYVTYSVLGLVASERRQEDLYRQYTKTAAGYKAGFLAAKGSVHAL